MSVQNFLHWAGTAGAAERASAAQALAEAYLWHEMTADERSVAETAMFFLLDDPSPKVRLALAEALSTSAAAPRAIVAALAQDQAEIAGAVLSVSPVLADADLVDIVAGGVPAAQQGIAARATVSVGISAAIAEVGNLSAVIALLDNPGAAIAAVSLRRIAERFGSEADVRSRLLDRPALPSDLRHRLILQLGEALARHAFVSSTVGAERLRRVTREACQNATLKLAEAVPGEELPALAEHLREVGSLTPSFLISLLCRGNVDFFAAAMVGLTGLAPGRVRSILVGGRENAVRALIEKAGIPRDTVPVFADAVLMWREAARRDMADAPASIPSRLVTRHAKAAAASRTISDLLALVERSDLAARRERARDYLSGLLGKAA